MIPLKSVEKSLWSARQGDQEFPFITSRENFTGDRDFENHLREKKIATQEEIFDYLISRHEVGFQKIAQILNDLLPPPHS